MEVLFMGTGASTGVPMIGCDCSVCQSSDPKNERTRSSIMVRVDGKNILVDTSPDLRIQSLKNHIKRIDAVIFTHPHADHILGIDELRTFNFWQKEEIPVFADPETLGTVMKMFPYAFSEENRGGLTRPRLAPREIVGAMKINEIQVTPFPVKHGPVYNHALRLDDLVYLTDCNEVSDEGMEVMKGVDTLIIGAVLYEPHASHFGIWQALDLIERVQPRQAFLTHLSHRIDYNELTTRLPSGVQAAFDGLTVSLPRRKIPVAS
ncbi:MULTISPECIES: MBL fold metallo-hydrolase [Leptospirillum]|jgi:phosphoribosyl 1,2-cyclic phosphate phosphodiesterase|nr:MULTISPECIES: MBL fold metallo-hydrolase [Leptospirillum]AFS53265.1 metal-dependent hydrolase of the beta-lactamase superfamily I [Leptospirillum ferriphilum ML-04]EAY57232.1 MAG: putative metallo-beta-lactamase family protein [Leptospirillum rubarum]EIJ76863.1 MAG: Putative metallo-beta-lactamase family protein [Leptospirillum sp. Group II 'C75']MCL5259753.1 MBL fold metallo-hydrolase [Nitrospirota bacterium]